MPYRPEAELKRPDLKGEFLCGHCGKTFCHAASLNRHRLNFHGDDQQCQLCEKKISPNETVRRHMAANHGITRVFTCGCCNWTFPDKKELHSHNNSMMKTGTPGDAKAIAVSSRPPGSLSQHELKGEERSPAIRTTSKKKKRTSEEAPTNNFTDIFSMLSNAAAPMRPNISTTSSDGLVPGTSVPTNWLQALLLNNPSLITVLQQQMQMQHQASSLGRSEDDEMCHQEQTSSSGDVDSVNQMSSSMDMMRSMFERSNNNNILLMQNEVIDPVHDEIPSRSFAEEDAEDDVIKGSFGGVEQIRQLLVNTSEVAESLSSAGSSTGPESGIGSGEEATDCSPSPSDRSKEGSPSSDHEMTTCSSLDVSINHNRKRKSVDAIATLLFKKKCLME